MIGSRKNIDWTFWIAAAGLIAGRILFYHLTRYTSDDAFITYRYARNIAAGQGFVYNIGEHVQGTSSPLYTLYLAALAVLFGPSTLPLLSFLTGIAADIVTLRLLWSIIPGAGNQARIFITAFFAIYPKIVLIGISGMEAPVVTMLMLLSWQFFREERFDAAFFIAAILLLTRLDAALWIILAAIVIVTTREEKFPLRSLIVPVLMYAAWTAFCYWYFGSWTPHSVTAKNVSWNHLFPRFDPGRIMLGYLPLHGLSVFPEPSWLMVVAALFVPVIVEGYFLSRDRSRLILFPVFFFFYNFIFSFGRVLMPDWYFYPGYLAYLVTLGSLANRMLPAAGSRRIFAGYAFLGATVFCLLVTYRMGYRRWSQNLGGMFVRQNQALGSWLKEHASPGSHVLLEPIGYVGWESNLYIDDYIGLVSPQIIEYRKRTPLSDRWYMEYLKDRTPDYVVQRNWEFPRNQLFHGHADGMFTEPENRKWFIDHYMLVPWNPHAEEEDSVYLVLYEHVDNSPMYGLLRRSR